jgi:8-oxo-dGTP pyrophosphatase MutT (NUDIX family)
MPSFPTKTQISAGGVAYRKVASRTEVALISVGANNRWQLPKGQVGDGEDPEAAALREVREEAGIQAEIIKPLETITYWFYVTQQGKRLRIHKFVHFYLMRYLSGDPDQHDQEVNEARWVDIDQAIDQLAFDSEREILRQAKESIVE